MNGIKVEPGTAQGGQHSFAPFAKGILYAAMVRRIEAALGARTYLEIGTKTGASVAGITCASICVDPQFELTRDVVAQKPLLLLFQMTSDAFFANHNPSMLLPAPGRIDLAFLDGMHHFEFLLRDLMNTERYCTSRSVILLHDCLPLRPYAARRRGDRRVAVDTRRPIATEGGGWTGDVWKLLPILRHYRPDLRMTAFDSPPSGLVAITGCDPTSTVLQEKYPEILERWKDAERKPGWFDALHDSIDLLPTRNLQRPEQLLAALGL